MSQNTEHFDAFISYRHSELDSFVAENLQKKLETFKIPRGSSDRVKSAGKKKEYHIFRDRDELPLVNSLTDYITKALECSDFLIVICSPRTPESLWVKREIETFIKFHGREHILAVLIEGEPAESFPEPLLLDEKETILPNGDIELVRTLVEPLAADVRAINKKHVNKKIKSEMLRLVAAMLSCSYDDLKQRHKERKNKRILIFSIALSIIGLTFGGFSYYQSCLIKNSLSQKNATQSRYLADSAFRFLDEGDRMKSILVSTEALPTNVSNPERPYVTYAEYALSSALQVYENNTSFCPDCTLTHDSYSQISKLSPSGTYLLCYDMSEYLYIWDTTTNKSVYKSKERVNGLGSEANRVYFINDTTIVYSDQNKTVCLDFINNKVLWENEHYTSSFMALNKDNTVLAIKSFDGLFFVNPLTGALLFQTTEVSTAASGNIMRFSPDSNYFAICSPSIDEPSKIDLFSLSSQTKIDTITTQTSLISDLLFSDNNNIFYCTSDAIEDPSELIGIRNAASVIYWDIVNKSKIWSYEFSNDHLNTLALNDFNKNQLVFKGSFDLYAIDVQTGKPSCKITESCEIVNYSLLPNTELAICAISDGSLKLSSLTYGIDLRELVSSNGSDVKNMLNEKGLVVSVLNNSSKLVLYRYKKGSKYEKLDTLESSIVNCIYSNNDKYILCLSEDGELHILDGTTKKILGTTSIATEVKLSSFCKNGQNFFVATKDGSISLYDTASQKLIKSYTCGEITNIKINQSQTTAFLQTNDEIIQLDLDNLLEKARFPYSIIQDYYISYDSTFLVIVLPNKIIVHNLTDNATKELAVSVDIQAIGHTSNTINLVDNNTNELQEYSLNELTLTHKQPITASAINFIQYDSKDERLFISKLDNSLEVYDCRTWEKLHTFTDIETTISQILFPEKSDCFVLQDSVRSYLCNSSYELVSSVPNLEDVSEDFTELLVSSDCELVKFPFYNLKMLLNEAKSQLNGAELSSEEKKQLFAD